MGLFDLLRSLPLKENFRAVVPRYSSWQGRKYSMKSTCSGRRRSNGMEKISNAGKSITARLPFPVTARSDGSISERRTSYKRFCAVTTINLSTERFRNNGFLFYRLINSNRFEKVFKTSQSLHGESRRCREATIKLNLPFDPAFSFEYALDEDGLTVGIRTSSTTC